MSLRTRLREATRDQHEELERLLPLAGTSPSPVHYREHLVFLLGFLEPLEERLAGVEGLVDVLPDVDRRRKAHLLRADLRLSRGTREPAEHLPEIGDRAAALGVLYVLEGSTLGGRVLLGRLRDAGVLPGELGSSYLEAYGADTGRMWSALCDALDRLPAPEGGRAVAAARATFSAMLEAGRTRSHA